MARPVFLAAADANQADLGLIDKLLVSLQVATGGALGATHVFVPHLNAGDVGVDIDAGPHFTRVMEALNAARVVVAVLDGPRTDDGVAFLVGCAFAAGKPVIGLVTDRRLKVHSLLEGASGVVVTDVKALAAALAPHLADA